MSTWTTQRHRALSVKEHYQHQHRAARRTSAVLYSPDGRRTYPREYFHRRLVSSFKINDCATTGSAVTRFRVDEVERARDGPRDTFEPELR